MKNNKQLTIALVNSILRVLDQVGPNHVCRRRRGVAVHRQELRAALDLDQLHQTGGTPGQDPQVKHRRMPLTLGVRVLERRPSPSPDLLAYWLMEPSDPATSPRGHRETPCAIHGWGTCPYPVASRRMKLSSPSSMEGGGGVATAK
jgi:hypothetical protein